MNRTFKSRLCGSSFSAVALCLLYPVAALADTPTDSSRSSSGAPTIQAALGADEGVIVVTAQKRSETVNRVGMSINAATGDQLAARGIVDTSQLGKIVPGFTFDATIYGAPVYTIRGIGFQESSLAASPAVSVYVDEVPLPFSAETLGAALDVERVEVLKGPQGTLYGQNSTGGAVNYVAAKPTDQFAAGLNGSFGRFNTGDITGYVSGPVAPDVESRISVRYLRADGWQKSATRPGHTLGHLDQLSGRWLTTWNAGSNLRLGLSVSGWRDHSDTPAQQFALYVPGIAPFANRTVAALSPTPQKSRLAEWDPGTSFRRDNYFYQAALRAEWDLGGSTTFTSISSYQRYDRDQPIDADGTQYQVLHILETGQVKTLFQELRLSGIFWGQGHWIVGGNYERDRTYDSHLFGLADATSSYTGGLQNENRQNVRTKAVYANAEYPVLDKLTLQGGLRYTDSDRHYLGCTRDTGNGIAGGIFGVAPGGCITALPSGSFGVVDANLNEDNVSWHVGLNYQLNSQVLI
jgi:outer membrane receptor protein involved in Fe transport